MIRRRGRSGGWRGKKQLPGVKWFLVSLQRRAGGWALSDAVFYSPD